MKSESELKRDVESELKCQIAEALRRSADVEAHRISVEATDAGKVTLFGNIFKWTEFNETQRAAWWVPGVSEVDNRLIIVP